MVTGDLALRMGFAQDVFGIAVPAELFTDDPAEQWLIREAVMAFYTEHMRRVEQAERLRQTERDESDQAWNRGRELLRGNG